MSQRKDLRGGLGNGDSEKTAMGKAVFKLSVKNTHRRISQLSSHSSEKMEQVNVSHGDGGERMTSGELGKHIDKLADMAYRFVLETACPAIWELERDIRDIGEEVLLERRQGKTRQEQRDEYELIISDLRRFCPQNDPDGILQREVEIEDQKDLIGAMCLRVRRSAEVAKLVFDLAHAETKNDLEDILENATEGVDSQVKVFKRSSNKEKRAKIWAFGQGYEIRDGVFGKYHDFAEDKCGEVIRTRSRELAADNKAKMQEEAKKVLAKYETRVSVDELFFNDADVNGKTALIFWKFKNQDNALLVQRSGNQLFLINAVGKKPMEDLEEMRRKVGDKPFVLLHHILDRDGKHLCPEEIVNGNPRYQFSGFVQLAAFKMTCWVRSGAGRCCDPSRLPNGSLEANRRPTKSLGELLTPEEFFYKDGLGEFDLHYEVGFNHELKNERGHPTGEVLTITEPAVARIERKEVNGRTIIVLKRASTEELATLLEKGCGAKRYGEEDGFVIVYGEFEQGNKFSLLPNALGNGLGLEYSRMKIRETQSAK